MTGELWCIVVMYFVGVAAGTYLGICLEKDKKGRCAYEEDHLT